MIEIYLFRYFHSVYDSRFVFVVVVVRKYRPQKAFVILRVLYVDTGVFVSDFVWKLDVRGGAQGVVTYDVNVDVD